MAILSFLLSLDIAVQATALGGNGALLSILAALLNIALALAILLAIYPPSRFWQAAGPTFALFVLAGGWAIMPAIVRFPTDAATAHALAGDRMGQGVVVFCGFLGMLAGAAILGSRHDTIRRSLNGLLMLAAINLIIGLFMREMDPNQVWGMPRPVGGDRFSGTFLNANAAACLFGMLALLSLGQFIACRQVRSDAGWRAMYWKIFTAFMSLANFGACVVTGSRTALLLLLIGCVLLLWRPGTVRRMNRMSLWSCLAIFAMAALLAVGDIVTQRVASLAYDAQTRLTIWSHYWAVSQHAPLTGFGLGAFSDVNLHFLRNDNEAAMFWYINDPHNLCLRLLLEGGWPYLLFMLAGFGTVVYRILSERRALLDRPHYRAMLVALGFALGCGMVDIALSVPAIGTLCATLLGLLWGRAIRVRADLIGPAPNLPQ